MGMPSSIFLKIFSVTTIPSSTTKPVASTMAKRVNTFMEKPARYIIKKHETKEMGMSMRGRMAIIQFLKKKKITRITRHSEMMSVSFTSSNDLRTLFVVSISIFISMSAFSERFSSSILLLNSSEMLM